MTGNNMTNVNAAGFTGPGAPVHRGRGLARTGRTQEGQASTWARAAAVVGQDRDPTPGACPARAAGVSATPPRERSHPQP